MSNASGPLFFANRDREARNWGHLRLPRTGRAYISNHDAPRPPAGIRQCPRSARLLQSLRWENALHQCTQIFQRRVRLEGCVRFGVVPRQPWQRRPAPRYQSPRSLKQFGR